MESYCPVEGTAPIAAFRSVRRDGTVQAAVLQEFNFYIGAYITLIRPTDGVCCPCLQNLCV